MERQIQAGCSSIITMANHRARAQFDRAKWHIGLLLPLWALQLTLAMAMTGLSAWRLGDSVKHGSAAGTRAVELAYVPVSLHTRP